MGNKKRGPLRLIKLAAAAVAAGCAISILAGSVVPVDRTDGLKLYHILPYDGQEEFETSEIFHDLLLDELEEVTNLAVLRGQLETDGSYDENKEIDVTSYVNRKETVSSGGVSATYEIGELISWYASGFTYETVTAPASEWEAYFNGEESTLTEGESDSASKEADGTMVTASLLTEKYLSSEGKPLAYYVSSLEEYEQLCANLEEAAAQLSECFDAYSEVKDTYTRNRSNLIYCFRLEMDGKAEYVTNLSGEEPEAWDEESLTAYFSSYSSYLTYDPDRVVVTGTIDFTVAELRDILAEYEYAFEEDSMLWVAVDTAYPVQDSLSGAHDEYVSFADSYRRLLFLCVAAVILLLLSWVLLLCTEGRKKSGQEGETDSLASDTRGSFPSDLLLLLFLLLLAAFVWLGLRGWNALLSYVSSDPGVNLNAAAAGCLAALWVVVADLLLTPMLLTLVYRGRAHIFWENTLCCKLCGLLKAAAWSAYDNAGIVGRWVVPFLFLAVFNLAMGVWGIWPAILAAGLVDAVAAVVLYGLRREVKEILETTQTICAGEVDTKLEPDSMHGENRELAEAINRIGDSIQQAVAISMKDERLKTDLITNVSHDIKTPLTSIINFVTLLKRENIEDERIRGYINVLDVKSQRLKQLTDDLVEASKISSGNISLALERLDFIELIRQTIGEFSEKMEEKRLTLISDMPEERVYILADSRRLWRVMENLFTNVCKYALEGTRVYLDVTVTDIGTNEDKNEREVSFCLKNISAGPLNMSAEELTERFIRGDVSRTTEGSGLGLSIAQSLTSMQKGQFELILDGDLFKVILRFPCLS